MATEKDPQNIAHEADAKQAAANEASAARIAESQKAANANQKLYEKMKTEAEKLEPPPSPKQIAGPEPFNEPTPESTTDPVEEIEERNEHNDSPRKKYDKGVEEVSALKAK